MTTLFKTKSIPENVEALPEFEGVKARFLEGFQDLMTRKKSHSVRKILREELERSSLANNADFIGRVIARVDESALQEKPFIFISVHQPEQED